MDDHDDETERDDQPEHDALQEHNARFDWWESLTPAEREAQIRWAMR